MENDSYAELCRICHGKLCEVHSTPAEAGQAAAEVEVLVLTHITVYRDAEAVCDEVREHFGRAVIAAEEGLRLATLF